MGSPAWLPHPSPRDLHHWDLGLRHSPRFPRVRDSGAHHFSRGLHHSPRLLNDVDRFVTHFPHEANDLPRDLHHSERGLKVSPLVPNGADRGANVSETLSAPSRKCLRASEMLARIVHAFHCMSKMYLGSLETLANDAGTELNVSRTVPVIRDRLGNVPSRLSCRSSGLGLLRPTPGRGRPRVPSP